MVHPDVTLTFCISHSA